jgi:hypothetical protein
MIVKKRELGKPNGFPHFMLKCVFEAVIEGDETVNLLDK